MQCARWESILKDNEDTEHRSKTYERNASLHLLPCHAQCSQGSLQALALPLGGGNEIISLHVLICLANFSLVFSTLRQFALIHSANE